MGFLRDAHVVIVRSVAPELLVERLGIPTGWIVARVNGADVECVDSAKVAAYFRVIWFM